MWTERQQLRLNLLREREEDGKLSEAEQVELDALIQELDDREAVYLHPSNAVKAREIASLEASVERLEAQNRQLQEYLRERQAFLTRARSLVEAIRAEDRQMRERYAELLPLIGEAPTVESS